MRVRAFTSLFCNRIWRGDSRRALRPLSGRRPGGAGAVCFLLAWPPTRSVAKALGRVGRSASANQKVREIFLGVRDVTRLAFESIQFGQSAKSRRSSRKPHRLSTAWATGRRRCRITSAFVAHGRNSILRQPSRCGGMFQSAGTTTNVPSILAGALGRPR